VVVLEVMEDTDMMALFEHVGKMMFPDGPVIPDGPDIKVDPRSKKR
jgi:hypothetical protein